MCIETLLLSAAIGAGSAAASGAFSKPKTVKPLPVEEAPVKSSTEIQTETEAARADLAFNTAGFAANILTGGLGDTSMPKVKKYAPT